MEDNDGGRIVMALLVAMIIVEAGALAIICNERNGLSDDLENLEMGAEMTQYLVDVSSEVQQELVLIDNATSAAVIELQGRDLDDEHADAILRNVSDASSNIISVLTTDINGTIVAVQPSSFSYIIGMDISYQTTMRCALEQGRAAISPLDYVVQGYYAVFMVYPVFDDEGRINGTIASMFRPDWTIGSMIDPGEADLSVMALQEDGVVLYDADPDQIGRNTFTDPIYDGFDEIKQIARRMVNESSGSGNYSFVISGEVVSKTVTWTTVGLLGVQWTVSVIRAV